MDTPAKLPTVEVLITLPLPEEALAPLRELGSKINLTVHIARRAEDVPEELWNKVEVLYTDRVLPAPGLVPNLRWLQFHSAGIDFAVDSPLLQAPDVRVTTLSGANAPNAAEFSLAMLLALAHHIPDVVNAQNRAEWPKEWTDKHPPQELRESTVGIVGYGSIGRELARLLQPLGVTVLAAKHDAMHPEDDGYFPEGTGDPNGDLFARLYPFQAVHTMVKECDFVVLTVPLTPETKNMFDEGVFAAMKPSAYLVNVGRGGVVDEAALLEALQEKRIAGAAMDVFAEEPLAPTSPLWKAPNLLITPHLAGHSTHYNQRAMQLFAANLRRYLTGAPLYNLYEAERGY